MSAQIYPFENILHAASIAELTGALLHASQHFGFSSFHYGAHAPVKPNGEPARFIFDGTEQKHGGVISSYPESWFNRYQAQNYIEIDPLVRHCSRSIIPVVWHLQPEPEDHTVRQMFDEASEHGLLTGATFSVIGKNSELAIFSLTTDSNTAADKRNIQAQLGGLYVAGPFARSRYPAGTHQQYVHPLRHPDTAGKGMPKLGFRRQDLMGNCPHPQCSRGHGNFSHQ
nr:autoinducer binding domain-containing protein [Paludibacterium denitrificans]